MSGTGVAKLTPFDAKKQQWRAVIETPKGSHNKYKFDEKMRTFMLNGVLPEGMSFPYDFGFLPLTLGEDGDPLDVLILTDEPTFCGCVVPARLIGIIEAEQTEDGKTERNDRIVAVPEKSRVFDDCRSLRDVEKNRVSEIEQFFVSYNRIHGKKFKVLNVQGPKKAEQMAREGMRRRKKKSA